MKTLCIVIITTAVVRPTLMLLTSLADVQLLEEKGRGWMTPCNTVALIVKEGLKSFLLRPSTSLSKGNLNVPHLGLIEMTSPSLNSAVILRDGQGTGTKAEHSLISGSVIRRWESPSGAAARRCRSSPAPPWAWPTNQSRPRQWRLRGSQTNKRRFVVECSHFWSFGLWIVSARQESLQRYCQDWRNRMFSTLFTASSYNWCCTGPSACLEEDKKQDGLGGLSESAYWILNNPGTSKALEGFIDFNSE